MKWPDDFIDKIVVGDCCHILRDMPDESVHCIVTSPPYWGLRDYGTPPQVWGGDRNCQHQWGDKIRRKGGSGIQGKSSQRLGRKNAKNQEKVRDSGAHCACGAWKGSLGLEPTPNLFVEHLVQVFREVRRVLRKDGTLWLNLGDCYATGAGKVGSCPGGGEQGERWKGKGKARKGSNRAQRGDGNNGIPFGPMVQPNRMPILGLKNKDICGMPWRVAFALQRDGAVDPAAMDVIYNIRAALLDSYDSWEEVPHLVRREIERLDNKHAQAQAGAWFLRSDIIWSKPNPMPESVTDRPTKAHEYLFLLAKSEKYYYDAEAIKEDADPESAGRYKYNFGGPKAETLTEEEADGPGTRTHPIGAREFAGKRNKRTVWNITTQSYSEAHFATFPPKLIEPCILAGTSEKGCCSKCGSSIRRITKTKYRNPGNRATNGPRSTERKHIEFGSAGYEKHLEKEVETIGWKPTCDCEAETLPCVVLDPFAGAGTTALVAAKHGRRSVSIELNPEYAEMARRRIKNEQAQGKFF